MDQRGGGSDGAPDPLCVECVLMIKLCCDCKYEDEDIDVHPCRNCEVIGGSNKSFWEPKPQEPSALDVQVAGDHYKKLKIQPVEYIHANNIPFIEGCIIKYASRWRDKGGIKDLEKIKHFADLLIELEKKNGNQ